VCCWNNCDDTPVHIFVFCLQTGNAMGKAFPVPEDCCHLYYSLLVPSCCEISLSPFIRFCWACVLIVFSCGGSLLTIVWLINDSFVSVFKLFHPPCNTAGSYAGISVYTIKSSINICSGKRPLGWPRCRWEDGIRMDFGEIDLGGCGFDSTGSVGTGGGLLWVWWWTFGFLHHGVSYK
jgi:hypothetical protein